MVVRYLQNILFIGTITIRVFLAIGMLFPCSLALMGGCTPQKVNLAAEKANCSKEMLPLEGALSVFRIQAERVFFFKAGMRIDADGAPNAYHPEDKGLDLLKYAGRPGDWQGIVTDSSGHPLLQGPRDPYPGYYISQTSLFNKAKKRTDPTCYVDARAIPYIVLPKDPILTTDGGVRLGDFAAVINTRNHRLTFAIFADQGPRGKIGEGSIALAELLQIPSSPRTGGIEGDIIYVLFPGSGNGQPRTRRDISREGQRAFRAWGGLSRLGSCYPEYQWDESLITIVGPK
jgi:hypothetical protein